MATKLEFTRHEIEDFVRSRVWKYLVATILDRTSSLMEDNNKLDPFIQPSLICKNQGMIAGFGEVIDLPAVMVEQIEYNSKVKKDATEEENS